MQTQDLSKAVRLFNAPAHAAEAGAANLVRNAAYFCLWLFIFAVPWEEQIAPGRPGIAVSRWFGLAATVFAIGCVMLTRRVAKPEVAHYWMVAFVLWASLSLIWTVDREDTAIRAGTYLQLLLMVWLFTELATTESRRLGLLYAYAFGTVVPCLTTIHDALLGRTNGSAIPTGGGEERFTAAGINENDLGVLLVLSVPMAIYLITRRKSSVFSYLCWVQLGLAITTIFLTGSRGSLISLCVALLIVPLCVTNMSKPHRSVLFVAFFAVAAAAFYFVPAETWERLSTIGSEITQGTLTHRTSIWAAGIDVFRHHALLGVGAGAYGTSVRSLLDIPYVSHNLFLSVLVELGVVGALILLVLLSTLFYSAAQLPKLERRFWTVLLLSWMVGVSSLTWEYRKPTWIVFGLLATQYTFTQTKKKRRPGASARPHGYNIQQLQVASTGGSAFLARNRRPFESRFRQ